MKLFVHIFLVLFIVSCKQKKADYSFQKDESTLNITIDKINYEKLVNYRNQALENGVIDKALKKYVKGVITKNGKEVPIKLRLKGDWTDHLKEEKWSFRIKISGDNAFMGLKTFSIQSPHTRSFLHEWFMHQVYQNENVLTTRYEFIPVYINGKEMGVYALEEHFDKQLVEAQNRREGPILKFNEESVWEARVKNPSVYLNLPYFESAEVVPFKKNRTLNNPTLKQHFKTAQNLLLRHKAFDKNIEEVFDLDKLAKFYALTDVANTDHALIWHNLRFYYNPVSRKLEPIAYDCYPEDVKFSINQPIFGHNPEKTAIGSYSYLHYYLFNNNEFKTLYVNYLKKFSNTSYLDKIFKKLQPSIDSLGAMLATEYPDAQFNKEFYYENILAINTILPEFSNSTVKYELKTHGFEDFTNTQSYYYNAGLKAYSDPFIDSINKVVKLFNFHSSSVTVIGYALKQNTDSVILLKDNITLEPYNNSSKYHIISTPKKTKTIYFIANNKRLDTLQINVSKWAFETGQISPVDNINTQGVYPDSSIKVNELNKLVKIEKGSHSFSEDIIIPHGWSFVVEEGVKIDLINNAAIISYSPVHAVGTELEKIEITSSDGSGQGLVVVDNYKKSFLQHVNFSNLNTLHKYGWSLTGAITFYQSDVTIDNCTFLNNSCEDALNLVSCNFSLSNSIIGSTFSDGFDSDFCKGIISQCVFKNTGNDCIDLSGSEVEITDCTIENSGDKGISGGEKSTVKVNNCSVSNAKIAIASKDLSTVYVNSISIKNVEYGYVAFQKKPEYGPAKIVVNSANESEVKNQMLIDMDATIIYNNDTIIGTNSVDVNSLYAAFN